MVEDNNAKEETSPSETNLKPNVSFEEEEKNGNANKQQWTNSQAGTARSDEEDDEEWVPPSKQDIELNARKARIGSRRVRSVMASSIKPAYFDDTPRKELTDAELMIVDVQAEEQNQRYCHYFKNRGQFITTVVLGALFVLAVVLIGIYLPQYLNCTFGCVNSISHLKRCFANGDAPTIQICPGTYSVYAPLQIYSGRKATIECGSKTPEETCVFEAPAENNFYIINFGEGDITFKGFVFTSPVSDVTGLGLFSTPSFNAGLSKLNFEYCSFTNSPLGFAMTSMSSTFQNCLISNNGEADSDDFDDSCTALDFSPSLIFSAGFVKFQTCIFEDNKCGNVVNVGRGTGGPESTPITFQDSTFRKNRADYVFNIGGAGLRGSGILIKDTLITDNIVSTSIFRQNQREAPVTINGTTFDNNQGPILSIRNANSVFILDTTITNNTNFVENDGVIDPLLDINGATDVYLSGLIIDGNDGTDTVNPSNEDASILNINNAGRNNTIGTVTMTNCVVQNNNATGAVVTIQGQTGLLLGTCLNEGTMIVENSSFDGNKIENPTNTQSILQLGCANSISVKNSMFTSNVQFVPPTPAGNTTGNGTSTTSTTTYQPLVYISTPSRKDALIENCIFDNNDWSNVAASVETDTGILIPSGGGIIRGSCFNSGTYRGTVNGAAVAAFPYKPRDIHLALVRSTNFYGPDNTFVSAATPCPGALYGFVDGGASTCESFNANRCRVTTANSGTSRLVRK